MKTFRISKTKYIADMSGIGASKFPGRWNLAEVPVLYTAENRALAILEVIVHLPFQKIIDPYSIATIEFPDGWAPNNVFDLAPEFSNYNFLKTNSALSQLIGTQWAIENISPVLKVPSVVVPGEFNFIINPSHPLFPAAKTVEVVDFNFDERLVWKSNIGK